MKKKKLKIKNTASNEKLMGSRMASKEAVLGNQFHNLKEARKRPPCLVTKYVDGEIAEQFYTK